MKILQKSPRNIWYKLDLSAIVYPTLQRRDFSSVYRISVTLKEKIDATILQLAVNKTLQRFPTYKSAMHKGLFWRYLEPNNEPGPFVAPDIQNPCMPMSFHANNHYLIRIFYYNNRISLEAHHCLGDGSGAMCVLQTLTATYLRLLGHSITNGGFVFDLLKEPDEEELEDAYLRYATSKVTPPRQKERTFRINGTKEPFFTLNIIDGIMSSNEVHSVASKYKATITEFLISVLIFSLQQKQKQESPLKERPIRIAMPVNLRRFFPSKTIRNFISMIYPSIDPRLGEYTFEDIIESVKNYMQYVLNKKKLCGDITTNAVTISNPVVRIIPLFIKDIIVRSFYANVQDKYSTSGLTNLGKIQVPPDMIPYIERFDVYMGQPFSSRTNCAIISFEDTLTINFSSSIVEADIEREFFRKLVVEGIKVTIETNRFMEEE